MPSKEAKFPVEEIAEKIAHLVFFDDDNKLLSLNQNVWEEAYAIFDGQIPKNHLYLYISKNRRGILGKIYADHSIDILKRFEKWTDEPVDSNWSAEDDVPWPYKGIRTTMELSEERWTRMRPQLDSDASGGELYLQPGWDGDLHSELWEKLELPCTFTLNARVNQEKFPFLSISAHCSQCGNVIRGWAKEDSETALKIHVSTYDTRSIRHPMRRFTKTVLMRQMEQKMIEDNTYNLRSRTVIKRGKPKQPESEERESKEPESKVPESEEPESKEPESEEPVSKEPEPKEPASEEPESEELESKEPESEEPESEEPEAKEPESEEQLPQRRAYSLAESFKTVESSSYYDPSTEGDHSRYFSISSEAWQSPEEDNEEHNLSNSTLFDEEQSNPGSANINLSRIRKAIPMLSNGGRVRLNKKDSETIGYQSVALSNTCAFDSIAHVFLEAYHEWPEYQSHVNASGNDFLSWIREWSELGECSGKVSQRRALILAQTVTFSSCSIDCTTNAGTLMRKLLLADDPSYSLRTECAICHHESMTKSVVFEPSLLPLYEHGIEALETTLEELASPTFECRECASRQGNHRILPGAHFIIDIEVLQSLQLARRQGFPSWSGTFTLAQIPLRPMFHQEMYRLAGVIEYKSHLEHYVGHVCQPDGEWRTYDDLAPAYVPVSMEGKMEERKISLLIYIRGTNAAMNSGEGTD
uniref:Ubiquitin-specific peptidase-like SUMO isopeptidase domain-containing protein n=1 Tax=Bracon brevicornis TaxID=1563983 RepID=A0A6V7ISU3_9HYME